MKLTIGMACYNNYTENWFTAQALRIYHDLSDAEILMVDNFGDANLKRYVDSWANEQVRYISYTDAQGTAAAKNRVFVEARGEWVFCIDSHVMLLPGTVSKLKWWLSEHPDCMDLLHGPILWDHLKSGADSFKDVWSGQMWGQWHTLHEDWNTQPFEVPMMGMGLFGCRKDAWLGFNPAFRGFGGEEGYIHAKFRQAGRKAICLPFLKWNHFFGPGPRAYVPLLKDKIMNYLIGFRELGLDITPIYEHFGREVVEGYDK